MVKLCVKFMYVTAMCKIVCDKVVVGGGRRAEEEEARDTESKTRTPHKVVGKKLIRSYFPKQDP